MNDSYYGSICLSDIPRELITIAANGKKYLNVYVNSRREVDAYGNTHSIRCSVPRELVLGEGAKLYIGKLRPVAMSAQTSTQSLSESTSTASLADPNDLPF